VGSTHPFFMGGRVNWEEWARTILEPLGYEVLEASYRGPKGREILSVRIERHDEVPVRVADLEVASRVLSQHIDCQIEVESPGSQRPLKTRRHFERFMGLKVRVRVPHGHVIGRIVAVSEEAVHLRLDSGEEQAFPLEGLEARLAEWPSQPR